MIGKIMQNHSFRATSRYVLEKEQAAIIDGNLFGQSGAEIVDELALTQALNPEIARPVYHLTQSYTAADKETGKLTDTRLAQLALRHFAGMVIAASEPALLEDTAAFHKRVRQFLKAEIHTHSFFVAVHQDREHLHTHLVASRLNLRDGKCIPTWYEQVRSKKVCRLLEQQFGLEPVTNTRATLDQPTRDRLVQTAGVLARLAQAGTSLEDTAYTLTRQGATLTLRRKHDDSIALKAYQDKQARWRARGGDLTEPERNWWAARHQTPAAASTSFEALAESQLKTQPAAVAPALIPALKTQPATVTPASEQTGELNHDAVQQLCLQKLPSLVAEIWRSYQERYPKAKGCEVGNGNYRLAAGEGNNPPTLWKHGTERLEWLPTEGRYQVNGLTLADYETIQRQAQKVRFASIETVAPLMAKFLEQQGVQRWQEPDSTYGLTRQDDLLTYYKQQERTIVYQAQRQQGHWTAITGQVPPEVKKKWLTWQRQQKAEALAAAKAAAKDKGR